jgi:hypothetical protein
MIIIIIKDGGNYMDNHQVFNSPFLTPVAVTDVFQKWMNWMKFRDRFGWEWQWAPTGATHEQSGATRQRGAGESWRIHGG